MRNNRGKIMGIDGSLEEKLKIMAIMYAMNMHFEKYFEKVDEIDKRLRSLEEKINLLGEKLDNFQYEKVVVVNEMSYEEAKEKVIEYFKIHKKASIVELHQDLGINIDTLIKILDELSKDGVIGD